MTTETRAGVQTAHMIVGGQPVDAADGQTFDVVDPADGTVIRTAGCVSRAARWASASKASAPPIAPSAHAACSRTSGSRSASA